MFPTLNKFIIKETLMCQGILWFAIGMHDKCYAKAWSQGAITSGSRAPAYGGIKALKNKNRLPYKVGFYLFH